MWFGLWAAVSAARAPDVVLVSMDTVRADVVGTPPPPGPYQGSTHVSPTLDELARRGVRFVAFSAHAPSTLSSHATLLTGLDPHHHGVPRNGFRLDPGTITLPQVLAETGYDTIAVLGSAALSATTGLDRGFRVYDDRQPAGAAESRADDVVRRALLAVDSRPDPERPLFLFVHFYDAHAPYDPPAQFDRYGADRTKPDPAAFRELARPARAGEASTADVERIASLYLGEVAFVDAQIGVLLAGLEARGLLGERRPGLLVVTADHGETLGDDLRYAWSHGSNVAPEVMTVPLLVEGRGLPLARNAVVANPAAMDGLSSTVLALIGQPRRLGLGIPFPEYTTPAPVLPGAGWPESPTIPVFLEATRPRHAEHPTRWNNLRLYRGFLAGGYGVVSAPFADVPSQRYPGTPAPGPELLAWLEAWVGRWDAAAPGHAEPIANPGHAAELRALGYVE
jgi:arylsulfatase A-like enzyme